MKINQAQLLALALVICIGSCLTESQIQNQQPIKIPANNPINFTELNQKLQTLNPDFLSLFSETFTVERIKQFNDTEAGNYLFMIGKMYIYDMLPSKLIFSGKGQQHQYELSYQSQSRYILGYYYLQMAAQVYENGDAYYYLAVLEYVKLTPTTLIKNNIKGLIQNLKKDQGRKVQENQNNLLKIVKQWQQEEIMEKEQLIEYLQDIAFDMESHHLHNTEHNLYLASVLGQIPAKLTLAYLLKQGISTDKNCSAAISYYLSVIKKTKVDTFQYPSDYADKKSFEKQLYSRQKLDLSKYGQYDPTVLLHTAMLDTESLSAIQDDAMKYMTGEDGYPINQALSIQIFERIASESRLARLMLGFMYLKGKGVKKNYPRARKLFETDQKSSKAAKQALIVMKFYSLGYEGKSKQALEEMKEMFYQYEKRMNITTMKQELKQKQAMAKNKNKAETNKDGNSKDTQNMQKDEQKENGEEQQVQELDGKTPQQILKSLRQRKQAFRTPMIKYLIGSLVFSDDIKGDKRHAINLIDEAAKQGNTLALTLLGILFIDGSDSSYDCQRSSNYFSKEALSHPAIQQRIQLAKMGIKKGKYMFSFIKYVQLMMVGYRNSFINALYVAEVYKDELFQFNELSWSLQQAQKNGIYKMLVKQEIVEKMSKHIVQSLGLDSQQLFNEKSIEYLTEVSEKQTKNQNKGKNQLSTSLNDYIAYINLKITSIGIMKHDISILRFVKYKQTKEISTLHQLANLGENSPHIYQARFLLGRYYHHTNITGSQETARLRRAAEEYNRATKNKLLGGIIYLIQGGEFKETQEILSHLYIYLTVIVILGVLLYRKKNKKMEQIFEMQRKKQEQQAKLLEKTEEYRQNIEQYNDQQVPRKLMRQESQLVKNELLFSMNNSSGEQQYKGPKFSEQQAENMINRRNLMNIGFMMDQKIKDLQSQDKYRALVKEQEMQSEQKKSRDQPIIYEDEENPKEHAN